jgi:hypothetical protein
MSRAATLLAALTDEPASTEELYDRVGYAALVRLGLVPYDDFRAALARLEQDGLAVSHGAASGATVWRRPGERAAPGAPEAAG